MSKYIFATVSLMALLLVFTTSAAAQAVKPDSPDEVAIKKIVKDVENGWNAHDGKAFALPFAADADYVVVNGMKIAGREAIEKGHVQIFTTIYKDSSNQGTIKSIRFLRPDVAVVHIEWSLVIKPGGAANPAMNTMIMTKDQGKWTIAAFQNTPIAPPGR